MASTPEAPTADGVEGVGAIVLLVAQRAAPPVEAMADAGRGTRAVAVTARLALRLGAVVPAPSNLTAALARSLAAAVPRASIGALRHAAALAAPPWPNRQT